MTSKMTNKHEIVTIEHSKLIENVKNKLIKAGESIKDLENTKKILKDKDS